MACKHIHEYNCHNTCLGLILGRKCFNLRSSAALEEEVNWSWLRENLVEQLQIKLSQSCKVSGGMGWEGRGGEWSGEAPLELDLI